MLKKVMAATAVTASVLGATAMATQGAMALGDDSGTTSLSGNDAKTAFGNSATAGDQSPQLTLVQGTLNKACLGVPAKANLGSLVGGIPITVQDVDVLSSPQNQQCAENSTQAKGDEPLSHLAEDIPVLSANGAANG